MDQGLHKKGLSERVVYNTRLRQPLFMDSIDGVSNLPLNQQGFRIFDEFLDLCEELNGFRTVDDAVIV
jgi:hypothetical protein